MLTCLSCKRDVPGTCFPGMRCPYCGAAAVYPSGPGNPTAVAGVATSSATPMFGASAGGVFTPPTPDQAALWRETQARQTTDREVANLKIELTALRARNMRRRLYDLVDAERDHQEQLYDKKSIAGPGVPLLKRLAILSEECGEVAKGCNDITDGKSVAATTRALRAELVQVAACAIGWLEAMDAGDAANPNQSADCDDE